MFENLTSEETVRALENAIPQTPQEFELGGGIYHKCHWKKCNEDLKLWWRYCPKCGQKIMWKGEEY